MAPPAGRVFIRAPFRSGGLQLHIRVNNIVSDRVKLNIGRCALIYEVALREFAD